MKQNYSRKLWPVKALAILVKIVRCLSCQRSLSAVIVIILKHFCFLIHQNIFYFVALSSWDISCCSTRPFGSKKTWQRHCCHLVAIKLHQTCWMSCKHLREYKYFLQVTSQIHKSTIKIELPSRLSE